MVDQLEQRAKLTAFLRQNGVDHFSGLEAVTLKRLRIRADLPPESWWPRILPAFLVAEKIRTAVGHPLLIGNGYRPKDLNKRVGGARNSQHIHFRALDIDLPADRQSSTHREALYRAAAELYLDIGARKKMGFGIYRPHGGSRVHIDCGWKQRCWSGPRNSWGAARNRWVKDLLAEVR